MEIFQNYSFTTCFPPYSMFLFPLKIGRRNRQRQSSDSQLTVRAISPLFFWAIFFQACFGNANNFTSSFSQNTNYPELVKELDEVKKQNASKNIKSMSTFVFLFQNCAYKFQNFLATFYFYFFHSKTNRLPYLRAYFKY